MTVYGEEHPLEAVSLFDYDRSSGMTSTGIKAELVCEYGAGYQRILQISKACRFAKKGLPIEHVSELLPKPRNGSLTLCNLGSRSSEECEIQCED